ncbi:MAG: hypothetical protein F6K41_26525 [Symploca sp. SIO3E6]|nr:hypothetical protein [Caldora sp. SIO3E6]
MQQIKIKEDRPLHLLTLSAKTEQELQELTTPDYWCHQIIQPVQLFASVDSLKREGVEIFVEIGPRPIVWRLTSQGKPDNETLWLPSLSPTETDWQQMLTSTAQLYLHGVSVNWVGFDRDYERSQFSLPIFPNN